jgi:VanZ family protein
MKYIPFLPAILIMCIIFLYSSKTAVESEHTSNQVSLMIINGYDTISNSNLSSIEKEELAMNLDFAVRKIAHGLEYMVLAISIAFPFYINGLDGKKLLVSALVFCIFYASTDEFHQLFVNGRSGQLRDVFIDGTGALIGTCVFLFLKNRIQLKRVQINDGNV